MRVTFWGTRGSLASPGPETVRYGGNTACVEVGDSSGGLIVLDAGTGIRRLGATLGEARTVHLFLTHLHLDHLQGLGFFAPLFRPEVEVHIWGPPSPRADLAARLNRYLSPPLFPVRLKELGSRVTLHPAPMQAIRVGDVEVVSELIVHPGPTVGSAKVTGPWPTCPTTNRHSALAAFRRRRSGHRATPWRSGSTSSSTTPSTQLTRGPAGLAGATVRSTRRWPSPERSERQPWRPSTTTRPAVMQTLTRSFVRSRQEPSSSCRPPRA